MGKIRYVRSSSGVVEIIGLTEKFTFNPKEGIDNPVMVITEEAESVSPTGPRLCFLKREEGESYGFHLRVEKGHEGHIVRNVVSGGIAERSDLRDGDRLLEVNNCYVDDVSHPEVAAKIRMSGNQLCLLVLGGDEYDQMWSKGQNMRDLVEKQRGENFKPPRLCHIRKDPSSGLGISFTPVEGEKGRFSVSLVMGGAAAKAGVCKGDRLVWMDGAAVCDLSHSALNRMLKKCGDHTTILVIDSENETKYLKQRRPILPTMAVPHNLPHRARKINLKSGSAGYGFLLRLEKTPSGQKFHVLREMENDSPAQRAGMKDGDVLLEVNGESVESLNHQQIVERVKSSGQQVSLTTITHQGQDFYSKLGLSPLLFCEDDSVQQNKENMTQTPAAEGKPPQKYPDTSRTRLFSFKKGPLGFGFYLDCDPQGPGTIISQVALGGSGHNAGLREGDVVIEVNGQNVEKTYLEDVKMLIKKGGNFLTMRVADKNEDRNQKRSHSPIRESSDSEEEDKYEISVL